MRPFDLAAMFRSGDLPFRPKHISQFFVVKVCLNEPVLAVQVYRDLLRFGGSNHAAERFLAMLETAKQSPFRLWYHEVKAKIKMVPLPK